MDSKKLNIAVIFGGNSSEHEISRLSAVSVIENLSDDKYRKYIIGITKKGEWLLYTGETSKIPSGEWEKDTVNLTHAIISPDSRTGGILKENSDGSFDIIKIDIIFPVLHGKNGEDGTIQGLFKISGIPYVGCDTLSSAICMDKAVTHTLLTAANIEQAHYLWFYSDRFDVAADTIKKKIIARLDFPVFVKPANAGSSVGVSKVEDEFGLDDAIKKAALEDSKIIVESGIKGQEVECAVIGNRDAKASIVGEIAPSASFYDYDDKYVSGSSQLFIPAKISDEIAEKIREIAVRAYRLLGCRGLARVDFFVTEDQRIILNEINTLPGFTSISMYPKLWMSMGMSCGEILDNLIDYALS